MLRVEVVVQVDDLRAIALCRARGFTIEGVARAHALRDGTLVDACRMARLGPALPYARLTAEEAASRQPPALPRTPTGPKRGAPGGGPHGVTGRGGGWGPRGGQA